MEDWKEKIQGQKMYSVNVSFQSQKPTKGKGFL